MSLMRTKLAIACAPLLSLALLAVPGAGSPAGAAVAGVSPGGPMVPGPPPVPGSAASTDLSAGTVHSTDWSGYAATGSKYTSVSASWVAPAVTCTGTTTPSVSGFWVGLDGDGDKPTAQTGTEAACVGGKPRYAAWYEMYPSKAVTYAADAVKPGDVISASVTADTATTFTLTIDDATRGWSRLAKKTVTTAPPRTSAEVITQAPCCGASGAIYPLADFGTVHFTKSQIDGLAINKFTLTRFDMAGTTYLKATTSALSSGTDFTITWDHS